MIITMTAALFAPSFNHPRAVRRGLPRDEREPMTTRTAERTEFLRDILAEGLAFASYWATVAEWDDDAATIADYDGKTHTVTLDTVAKGINYSNMGYNRSPHGGTRARIAKYNRSNGMDSDADAIDYDAIIQLGLFGKVVYG